MAEPENIKRAREALALADALAPETERLQRKSAKLKEEMDVLMRARDIMRERREKRENAGK
jgi:hypothetical protein